MTPQEYCAALEAALTAMPPEERQETVRYYREFLEEAEDAERSALGSPEQLAARILQESGIVPPETAPSPHHRTAKIVALVCTSYIWLPLLATWYVLLLCALICLVVIPVSLAACLPVCLFVAVWMIPHDLLRTLLAAGMGLTCIGAATLLTPPLWTACRSVVKFTGFTTKKLWHAIVS